MRSTLIYYASVANFVIALNNFFQERGHNSIEIGQKLFKLFRSQTYRSHAHGKRKCKTPSLKTESILIGFWCAIPKEIQKSFISPYWGTFRTNGPAFYLVPAITQCFPTDRINKNPDFGWGQWGTTTPVQRRLRHLLSGHDPVSQNHTLWALLPWQVPQKMALPQRPVSNVPGKPHWRWVKTVM